jgi:hypothetical protein
LARQKSANSGREQVQQHTHATDYLLDHLVGGGEQLIGHGDAERPGGLVIDDQLEFRRLHHRQVRGLHVLEDAAGLDADMTQPIRNVGSVAHESAGFGRFARRKCHGDRVLCRQDGNLHPSDDKKTFVANEERVGPFAP